MDIIEAVKGAMPGREEGPEVRREGDALIIDCRGCRLRPVPGSEECIGCMVRSMCSAGGTDRIVLRTGTDTEVSGAAGRAIREAASMMRWTSACEKLPARCRACPASRARVMEAAWAAFPANAVFTGRKMIEEANRDREGCSECVMRTSRALDQMELGIRRMVSQMTGRAVR